MDVYIAYWATAINSVKMAGQQLPRWNVATVRLWSNKDFVKES